MLRFGRVWEGNRGITEEPPHQTDLERAAQSGEAREADSLHDRHGTQPARSRPLHDGTRNSRISRSVSFFQSRRQSVSRPVNPSTCI